MTGQSWWPKVEYRPMSLPPDALEEFGNGLLTIFWLSQHALDSVRSKTPAQM